MIKLAIKNLWARRSSNIWLTIELVAVTIIAWMIIDPVVVRVYDATRPLGYDRDRLVQLWFSSYDSLSTRYDRSSADSATCVTHIYELQRVAGRLPQVESVTFTSEYYSPESQSINLNTIYGADTLSALESYFIPESRFLTTIGAKSVEGSPTVEE
ncbi:MAG: hypothetical protein K2O12_00620, partial [Muribaculaceae bacterium]|nr:hypothetical protein [Muribaculaceae bacterium]